MFTPTDVRLERIARPSVIAADLDGDGRIDLAAAVRISDDGHPEFEEGYAYVFAGKGDGTFGAARYRCRTARSGSSRVISRATDASISRR